MFEMKFSRFWDCLYTTKNSPEQSVELTQKKAPDTETEHSWYSYFVTIFSHCYGVIIEGH